MSDELRITTENARQAISICMANFIQQYSQKCNIKLQGWIEKSKVNLKQEVCAVIQQKVKVDVNPQDILEIHRIQGNRNKKCPASAFDLFQFSKLSELKSNISRTKGILIGFKINSNTICSGTMYQFTMDDRTFQNSWRNIYR